MCEGCRNLDMNVRGASDEDGTTGPLAHFMTATGPEDTTTPGHGDYAELSNGTMRHETGRRANDERRV